MEDIKERNNRLKQVVVETMDRLNIDQLEDEISLLQAESRVPDFWKDNLKAQDVMRRLANLENRVTPWKEIKKIIDEIDDWVELDDQSVSEGLEAQLSEAEEKVNSLKEQLKFEGPYDSEDVIMSIHAGAGGTDAQDWAQMLLRMYVRWAEKHNFAVKVIDESSGEEAGLKSVTFEIDGAYMYGLLKGEHGVHRLVRLSPFNADNLRQTSFAKVEVLPKITEPDDVEINEKDLKIDVYHSGGAGGQSVNTTDSAVRVTHIPTGITVSIQNERSQLQNRETAITILRSRLVQLELEQHRSNLEGIKGPNQSAEWGNQIRSYVLHPYKQVKDLRTKYEVTDPDGVLDGDLDGFIEAYLDQKG